MGVGQAGIDLDGSFKLGYGRIRFRLAQQHETERRVNGCFFRCQCYCRLDDPLRLGTVPGSVQQPGILDHGRYKTRIQIERSSGRPRGGGQIKVALLDQAQIQVCRR